MRKPRNVREFMQETELELMEGSIDADCVFTGPNTVVRRGEWENAGIVVPFVERVKFRPTMKGKNVFVNVRNAVNNLEFELFAGWSDNNYEFTGLNTVSRHGAWEIEIGKGIKIPFTADIKFARPRPAA